MARVYSGIIFGILAVSAASLIWAGPETAQVFPSATSNSSTTPSISSAPTSQSTANFSKAVKSKAPQMGPQVVQAPKSDISKTNGSANSKAATIPKPEAALSQPKPILADAFIAQNVLRVFLNRPAAISVYNTRGQQVYHSDSQRSIEEVPLHGVNTGFVYLTVRTAQGEVTKKLVYTGK